MWDFDEGGGGSDVDDDDDADADADGVESAELRAGRFVVRQAETWLTLGSEVAPTLP